LEYLNAYYDTTPDETFAKDYLQTEPPRIPHPPPSGRRWENYFSITTGASRGNTEYFACFIDPKNLDLGHPSYTPFSAYEDQVLAGARTPGLPNHPNQIYSPQPSYSNVRSQPPNPYAQANPQPYTQSNPQPYAQAYPQPSAQPYAQAYPQPSAQPQAQQHQAMAPHLPPASRMYPTQSSGGGTTPSRRGQNQKRSLDPGSGEGSSSGRRKKPKS